MKKKTYLKNLVKLICFIGRIGKNNPLTLLKINYLAVNSKKKFSPLCFDLEVASVCDLACGFCYRQYISTPDKL